MGNVTITLTRDELYEIQLALTDRANNVFQDSIKAPDGVLYDILRRQYDRCNQALYSIQQSTK